MILYLSKVLHYLVGGAFYTEMKQYPLYCTEDSILDDRNYAAAETYFPFYLSLNVSATKHARAYSFRLKREEDE